MSELPDIHDALFRLGDELAMEPDDWIDQLLASGALVEVTIDYEAAKKVLAEAVRYIPATYATTDEWVATVFAAAIGDGE